MEAIIFSIFSFISTTLGGLFALKNQHRLHYVMSFTAGVILAVCFFDIIPEAITLINENNLNITPFSTAIVIGFIAFHVLEKTILIHHGHEEEYESHKHPTVGLIGASGLSLHSFLDGVGIGLGFHINPHIGFLIAVAVISHDFSDGLNTVTLMLTHKNTHQKAIKLLMLDAIAPILGVLSTYLFAIPQNLLVVYLGFFAGFLLYIGASDMLPEAHSKHSSYGMIGLTILGAIFIFAVSRLT